ncbi:hypothetical protein [Rhizobium sp. NFR03]|uniref:hypothetical protein n=1 Tax=Rhizobium sp. NFR03 TaxID=1566263 RepID=UPI0008B3EACB|nr:hypothetical protein [Rhizobium sp. NFR03]SES05343.1 hypothetical protein SAMN03159406_01947 [Rhizobium sp. NFR03]
MSLRALYEDMPAYEVGRRVSELDWYSCTSLKTPPPSYDPIFTPLFVAMGFTGTVLGTSITTAGLLSSIATTALTFGIQALMAPKPPKPEDGKAPKTQAIPYRIWCVGRNRMAGAFMFWEARDRSLYAVQAIAGHRVHSFNRYWLHDDEVTLTPDGYTDLPDDGRYGNNVRIQTRLGLPTETPYQNLVDEFSSEGIWTSSHRGDGTASLCMQANSTSAKKQQEKFPYGVPNVTVEVDGARCWDFRNPAQSPTNPATWTFTRNAAIILAWHLCFSEFGERLDYTKAIIPVLAMWKEEADICDEAVALKGGGTEKRYECNGWDTAENSPKAALNAILAACDGHLVVRGDGARILTVGKFRESRCTTLTDADIIGHSIQYDVLFEDEVNRLVPKFTYPEIDYATTDADYFEDTAAQLRAGRVLSEEAEYTWVQQWRQARRLGKREWLRIQQKVNGSIDVRLSGVNAVYSRWVRLSTPMRLSRLNGKIVENRRSVVALTKGGFTMDIKLHPDNIDAWNPTVDEGKQPPVPPKPNLNDIITPVINLVQARSNGTSVYIRVDLVDPEDDSLTPLVRYRIADDGSGNPGGWVEQEFPEVNPASGFIKLSTNVVPSNKLLDIQASYKDSNKSGNWTITANVNSTLDPTAPDSPVDLQVPVSAGTVTFSARAAENDDQFGATYVLIFKRGTTSQSFADALLSKRLRCGPNEVRSITSTPGPGTWRYWCAGENVSKIVGVPDYRDVVVT